LPDDYATPLDETNRYGTQMASAEVSITLLDSKSGVEFAKLVLPLKGSLGSVHIDALAFSLDSTQLASTFRTGTVTLWDIKLGAELATLESHGFDTHKAVAFSPDGTRLASASVCGTLRLLDVGSSLSQ
jgi:WD40 repeat protein